MNDILEILFGILMIVGVLHTLGLVAYYWYWILKKK